MGPMHKKIEQMLDIPTTRNEDEKRLAIVNAILALADAIDAQDAAQA